MRFVLLIGLIGLCLVSSLESDSNFIDQDDLRDVDYEMSPLTKYIKENQDYLEKHPFIAEVEEMIARQQWEKLVNQHVNENNSELGFDYNNKDDTCENRIRDGTIADFYYFVPSFRGQVFKAGDSIHFGGHCFRENTLTFVSLSDKKAVIEITHSKPKNPFCKESLLIATSRIHESKTSFFARKHRITLHKLKEEDLTEIAVSGIRILGFCENSEKELLSLFKTVKLYLGGFSPKHGHVPQYMANANLDFIRRYVGVEFKPRGEWGKKIIDIKSEIKTGDFIAITRLDGVDELIMMGTGSTVGHSTVACWIDGELYVLESQDGWYWPKHGIQRNTFDDWIKYAFAADFNVVIMPLKQELREKFNTQKAIDWFLTKEGLNYGYHNFLYSWVDGMHNMPGFLDYKVILPLFGIFDDILPKVYDKILGESLNLRVGTKGLSLKKVVYEASKKNQTFEDLMAIPEREGWVYSDGENYVCSCFVIGFYKAAGLFEGLDIQPQEFSPKDLFQINFYQKGNRPKVCEEADPESEFCQIMGKYRLAFPHSSSIDPYTKMNERCDSESPLFIRNEGC